MTQQGYISGDPWTICDGCGWKVRRSAVRKSWDGFMLCEKDWEPKHEQLATTPVFRGEGKMLPNARPERTDTFVGEGDITEDDF